MKSEKLCRIATWLVLIVLFLALFAGYSSSISPKAEALPIVVPSPILSIVPTPTPAPPPEPTPDSEPTLEPEEAEDYIVNLNTGKFHYPDCFSVDRMKEHNKMDFTGSRDTLIAHGYVPCKKCKP